MLLQNPSALSLWTQNVCQPSAVVYPRKTSRALLAGAPSADETLLELEGPFNPRVAQEHWGKRPFLWRQALNAKDLLADGTWPSWEDLVDLACPTEEAEPEESGDEEEDDYWNSEQQGDDAYYAYEDDEKEFSAGDSARLVRHVPGELDSFQLDLGPFARDELRAIPSDERWSLLVNDVDRYVPALADWMDEVFGFLPRWRRDDAQVSLAPTGGGIGPHVDSYDVFLIQVTGQREWQIQPHPLVSVKEEMDRMIPGLPVRILASATSENASDPSPPMHSIHLEPGDLLYLPPRVLHWGTSLSEDCITLSVGCRAPSAQELVARVAERVMESMDPAAVQRYSEHRPEPLSPSLTIETRDLMKEMVKNAVDNVLNDEVAWDALVGKVATEPKRFSNIQRHEEREESYLDTWGIKPRQVLARVRQSAQAVLRRTPGVSMATSQVTSETHKVDRFYANGELWQVRDDDGVAAEIFRRIEKGLPLTGSDHLFELSDEMEGVLVDLIAEGLLTPSKVSEKV